MNQTIIRTSIFALLFSMVGCLGPRMQYTMKIPPQCGNQISPNGEPENKRYATAYDAFWWQCIKVKSENIDNRCESSCSGSSCATYGCFEGGVDAENEIRKLINNYGQIAYKDILRPCLRQKNAEKRQKCILGNKAIS